MGGGGDDGHAFAHAGDDAARIDGGDAFIVAFPGKVRRRVVGGVAGRAVDLEGQRAAGEQRRRRGDDVEGLDRHDDADGHLRVDVGTVGSDGGDLHRAGFEAGDGGGAVAVVADAGVAGVAHAPVDILGDVDGGTVLGEGDRAHEQALVADTDFSALGVDQLQADLAHRDGDADRGLRLQAVVGSGGDDGRALAHAGDDALFVDGDDAFIAAFPGEVRRRVVGGVGGRAVDLQQQRVADEEVGARLGHPAAGYRHDHAHGDLAAQPGAVVDISLDLHDAGAHAAHRAGAVEVLAHLGDLRVGGLPGEVLAHVLAGVVCAQRGGAQGQVAGTDVDLGLVGADQHDLHLVGGDADSDQAGIREAVVGGGGDDGDALVDAGDHAVFDGGDRIIAGLPGKVGQRAVGGVGRRAAGGERDALAGEHLRRIGDGEAGHRHDHRHGDLAAQPGTGGGVGVDLGGAGARAAHRAGAVKVFADLGDVGVGGLPGEGLANVLAPARGVVSGGAQRQVAGIEVDFRLFAIRGGNDDLIGGCGHGDDAHLRKAVVGSGGDGGVADAHGGEFAGVHGDDVLVAAAPGEVRDAVVGGVAGRAVELELQRVAHEHLRHFGDDVEAGHRHDHADGDLAGNAAAIGGIGIDPHRTGGYAGHGAGAVAVRLHAGIARVGGAPGELLLYVVGGAVRAIGGGAQRQVALALGDLGLAAVRRVDDDGAHGVGDLHQAGGGAPVERACDQAHLTGHFAGEVAAFVDAGSARHRLDRPEDAAGLRPGGADGGGEARGLTDDDFRRRRQRHGGGQQRHGDLHAHRVERAGARGDGDRAGSAQRLHDGAGLRGGHGGDALIARRPGDGQVQDLVRADLEAEGGVLVQIERVVRVHRAVVVVDGGAQNRRVERHFRAKEGARRDLATVRAEGRHVVVAELRALGIPAQAAVAAGERPAVEHLAGGRLGLGERVEGLRRHRGERAAAQQFVVAAVEGDDHALFAFLRLGSRRVQRGQLQARFAGGGDGLAILVELVDGRGVGDERGIRGSGELVKGQRTGLEQRAVGQLPAGEDQSGIGAGRRQLDGIALAQKHRLRIALVAQQQLYGIDGLHRFAGRVGAVAGEVYRGGQHQAGKAALVELGEGLHLGKADRGGVSGGEHALAVGVPAVDGAAGVEGGEVVAQALAGVVVEYVVAVAFVGLIAGGEGDGFVGAVLVNAHARAGARPGAGVEHNFDHAVLRHALEHRGDIDFHRGQAVIQHDARHGDHLQKIVVGKARRVRRHERAGAGGGVVIAAHVVLHAPTAQALAVQRHVADGEGDGLASGGEAHIALFAVHVGDGDVEDDGLFRVRGHDQFGAQLNEVFVLRVLAGERHQLVIADGSLVRRPLLAAFERPARAGDARGQGIGKGHVFFAGRDRQRADGLSAVDQQQLHARPIAFGGLVLLVIGAHFQALVRAFRHGQAGGHRAEALHELFIRQRFAGFEHHAVEVRAAVDAAPVGRIPLAFLQLGDGLGRFALIEAHAAHFLQRPVLLAGVLVEGEDDALFLVAEDIHVNAVGVGAIGHAVPMHILIRQRRLAFRQIARHFAVAAGQRPGRALGQHVRQGVSLVRLLGAEGQRRGTDAVFLALSGGVVEGDAVHGQVALHRIGGAQIDDDGAEVVRGLVDVRRDQVVKGHRARVGGAEGEGISFADAFPTGVRVGVIGGQHRQRRGRTALDERGLQQQRASVAVVDVQVDDAQGRTLVHAAHVQRRVGSGEQADLAHGQVRSLGRLRRGFH